MIIEAIANLNEAGKYRKTTARLQGSTFDAIEYQFADVDNYIKSNFNITSYSYEDIDAWGELHSSISYDKNNNRFLEVIIPTGGITPDFLDAHNILPQKYYEDDDYYYVHAKILLIFQMTAEYFCAEYSMCDEFDNIGECAEAFGLDEEGINNMLYEIIPITVFHSLDFRRDFTGDRIINHHNVFDDEFKVACASDPYENQPRVANDIKAFIGYNKLVENAPIYQFVFTKDNLLLDRIERVK